MAGSGRDGGRGPPSSHRQIMIPALVSYRTFPWLVICLAVPALHAHVHVQIGHGPAGWDLHVFDFESGRFPPDEAPFVVAISARQPMPADPRFSSFLGTGGNAWILPQNEAPGVLNLGLGTSGIAAGVFGGNQVRLELHRMEGPGHFVLFTTSPFGTPTFHFASRDGVRPDADFILLPAVNGHVHVNWAFTAPGIYRVGLAASALSSATGQVSASPVTDFTFIVEARATPRLEIAPPASEGTVNLRLTAPAGLSVELQSATELGAWSSLGTLTATGGPQTFAVPPATGSQRYFRALTP